MAAKVIAFANQKGGVGKTTSTLTLGGALARKGYRVLVLDLDPHVCASVHLRFYPETLSHTVMDLFLTPEEGWADLWPKLIMRHEWQSYDMVPGHTRLSELESDLKEKRGKGLILRQALDPVADHYDYILLDCPPHMGLLMANALVASDLLIIPIQTDFLALHGLMLLFDTLRTLNKALPTPIKYRTLATMYDRRAKACTRVLDMLMEKMGPAMFQTIIGIDTRFRDASALGKTIYDVDPQSRGAKAYLALAEEVVSLW